MRAEPVEVRVPVYVPLRDELIGPIPRPRLAASPATNEDLVELAEERGAMIDRANRQLEEIRKLQPRQPAAK